MNTEKEEEIDRLKERKLTYRDYRLLLPNKRHVLRCCHLLYKVLLLLLKPAHLVLLLLYQLLQWVCADA
jgi:hypothetical protein